MAIIKSLSDQVYEYVFHLIKVGKIAVGDKIDEAELIKKLGISRTPIREALIQMTSDNLLDNVPRKGFFVKSIDEVEMQECFAVIAQLDAYVMELAMPNIEDEHIRRMATAVEKMSLAISKSDEDMYYDWEQEFHTIYREVCGNTVLTNMIKELTRKAFRSEAFAKSTSTKEDYWELMNKDHRDILNAVENRRSGSGTELSPCALDRIKCRQHKFYFEVLTMKGISDAISKSRKIVIKIGSNVLSDENGTVNRDILHNIVEQVAKLIDMASRSSSCHRAPGYAA